MRFFRMSSCSLGGIDEAAGCSNDKHNMLTSSGQGTQYSDSFNPTHPHSFSFSSCILLDGGQATGVALRTAISADANAGVPSTKGILA